MARKLYERKDAVILFVVQSIEENRVDQRKIEYALTKKYGIFVKRKTLLGIEASAKLIGENNELEIDQNIATVCYFRAGYTPRDYTSEKEWKAREINEKSYSIKCPSIHYQIRGLKKIQQVIAEPSVLEKIC